MRIVKALVYFYVNLHHVIYVTIKLVLVSFITTQFTVSRSQVLYSTVPGNVLLFVSDSE